MSVRRSFAWAFSGQIVTFIVMFAGSVILARLLSPREMGVYAVATATTGVIAIIAAFGVGSYVVREVNLTSAKLDTAFTIQAIISMVLASCIFGVSWAGSIFLGDPGVGQILRLLAFGPLLGVFEFRPSIMLQREMQFKASTIIGSSASLLNAVLTISLARIGFSYMSMAWAALVSGFYSAIAYNIVARRHVSLRTSLVNWRPMLVFGLRMLSVGGVGAATQRLSDIVLGHTLGVTALGIFSRASNLSSLIFNNIYGTATRVIFTKMSKDFRERGVLRDVFLSGLEMILAVMWPFLIGLAILSRPVIYILYGPKWLSASLPLSMLMLAQVCTLSFGMNWELFVLRDETAKQTKYEVTRSFLGFLLFSIGCLFNLFAASLGRLLDSAVGALFYFPKMNQLAGTEPHELARVYRSSALLTLAATTPSAALMVATHWAPDVAVWLLALSVGAGVGLWFAVLSLLRHPLLDELGRALRRLGLWRDIRQG